MSDNFTLQDTEAKLISTSGYNLRLVLVDCPGTIIENFTQTLFDHFPEIQEDDGSIESPNASVIHLFICEEQPTGLHPLMRFKSSVNTRLESWSVLPELAKDPEVLDAIKEMTIAMLYSCSIESKKPLEFTPEFKEKMNWTCLEHSKELALKYKELWAERMVLSYSHQNVKYSEAA